MQRQLAHHEYSSGLSAEERAIKSLATSIAGDGADEGMVELAEALIERRVYGSGQVYPQGHPLAGQPKPMTADEVMAMGDSIRERLNGVRGSMLKTLGSTPASPAPHGGGVPPTPPAPGGAGPQGGAPAEGGQQGLYNRDHVRQQAEFFASQIAGQSGLVPQQ